MFAKCSILVRDKYRIGFSFFSKGNFRAALTKEREASKSVGATSLRSLARRGDFAASTYLRALLLSGG